MDFSATLKLLYQDKLVLTAMKADSIDVSDELAAVVKKISAVKKMIDSVDVIDYYQRRKRWKSGNKLTDTQKEAIREKRTLHPNTIAEEVFSE